VALSKIFQTVPIPYRTPAQRVATRLTVGLLDTYNPWLITPPRLYAEDLVSGLGCQAMWVTRETLLDGFTVINMLLWEDQIYYPSWGTVKQRFDATSGAAMETTDLTLSVPALGPIWIAYTRSITAAFDGSLWRNELNADVTQIDAADFSVVRGPYNASSYGGISGFGIPMVDPANDVLITSDSFAQNEIFIFSLSLAGKQLANFFLPGNAVAICPVTTTNKSTLFYVLTADNILCLCDYSTASIVSAFILPSEASAGASKINLAWDPVRSLLLVFSQVADNADGSSASIVRGYFPVPRPERLTAPIPLLPPRQYQSVPVATRLVGDLGHPIGGVNVSGTIESTSPSAGASLNRPTAATNANGYASLQLTGSLQCTVDLEVDATVDT
jgi:hypothetical protein